MAYITREQALRESRTSFTTKGIAESVMKKAASAPLTQKYDIFLSHAFEDAELIAGVKVLIERQGLTTYVDWIEDPEADRSKVTPKTAQMLRERMKHCSFLVFATSKASPNSKWMPWELGYFDGLHPNQVGILPIVDSPSATFTGQEYIGLYQVWQLHEFKNEGTRIGRLTGPAVGETLKHRASRRQ